MKISSVPVEAVDSVWPMVEPMLQRALDKNPGLYTARDLKKDLVEGAQVLWVIFADGNIDAAFTSRVVQYPVSRMLVVEYLGGDHMVDWLEHGLEILESYANDMGCTRMEVYGRKGWKILKKYGWQDAAVIYRKEL